MKELAVWNCALAGPARPERMPIADAGCEDSVRFARERPMEP
jgi:hypothetical protein